MKSYPSHITVNQLSELTGRDRRTIAKKLEGLTPVSEGTHGGLYDIRAALRMIFDFNPEDDQKVKFESEDFQPAQEKAKLDFVKRQAMELEIQEKERNLIPKAEILEGLQKVFASVKAKLQGLPTKAAQQIQGPPQKQTESILRKIVDDALTELSESRFDEQDS